MTRAHRALLALVLGLALSVGSLLGSMPGWSAGPAAADPIGSCSSTRGVIVAVDFSHWGGSVQRGCDATPTTGFDALHAAGFTTEGTRHDGPAFICRINNQPTPAQDACVLTPPATAYWSSWHADPGQTSWSYSTLGALSYHPAAGSVDAWVFGGTDVAGSRGGPSFSPAAVRASIPTAPSTPATTSRPPSRTSTSTPAPRTSSTSSPPTTPSSAPPTGVVPTAGSSSPGSSTTASTSNPPGSSATATSGATTGTPGEPAGSTASSSAPGSSGPSFADVTATASRSTSSGSLGPVLIAVAIALVLAGGAGFATWRRRQGG